jgi:hypothetical protein
LENIVNIRGKDKEQLKFLLKVMRLINHAPLAKGITLNLREFRLDKAVDCVRAFTPDEFTPEEDFADVFSIWLQLQRPTTRAVLALRYGLFSGVTFNATEVSLLLGFSVRWIISVEQKLAQAFPEQWAEAGAMAMAGGPRGGPEEDC